MINARVTWWGKLVLAWFAAGVVVSLVIGVGAALTHRWVRDVHRDFYGRVVLSGSDGFGFYTPDVPHYGVHWKITGGPLIQIVQSECMGRMQKDAVRDQDLAERYVGPPRVNMRDRPPPFWSMAAVRRPSIGSEISRSYEMWTDVAYGWPCRVVASRLVETRPLFPPSQIGPKPKPQLDAIAGPWKSVRTDRPTLPGWLERALGDAAQDVPGRVLWSGLALSGAVWGAMLAGPWYVVKLTLSGVRWWRRRRYGRCAKCGYSRDGLAVGAVCPECGGSP